MRIVDHREVISVIGGGGQVVDVLPAHEFRIAAIRGSIHLPLPKLIHNAEHALDKRRAVVVYCRDCLCDWSARAAAQLEFLGFRDVMHYLRGKADWMIRGFPCEPRPSMHEKLRALPYFINNLAPGIRANWISISRRATVIESTKDDLPRIRPSDPIPIAADNNSVAAVVLNSDGVLLGAIEANANTARAIEVMNPAPQTIRPDMTHRLASSLLESNRYILVTTSLGKYIGRYIPPATSG